MEDVTAFENGAGLILEISHAADAHLIFVSQKIGLAGALLMEARWAFLLIFEAHASVAALFVYLLAEIVFNWGLCLSGDDHLEVWSFAGQQIEVA